MVVLFRTLTSDTRAETELLWRSVLTGTSVENISLSRMRQRDDLIVRKLSRFVYFVKLFAEENCAFDVGLKYNIKLTTEGCPPVYTQAALASAPCKYLTLRTPVYCQLFPYAPFLKLHLDGRSLQH